MRNATSERTTHPVLTFWVIAGWVGFCLLPWYMVEDGLLSFEWLRDGYPFDEDYAPAAFLIAQGKKLWLAPLLIALILPLFALRRPKSDPWFARLLILSGAIGFGWLIAQGFSIGIRGFNFDWLAAVFGELGDRQFGMGYGGMITASAFLFLLTQGVAARGAINGDVFVVSAIGGVIAIVAVFVFFPIAKMLFAAFVTEDGAYSIAVFADKLFDDRLWSLGCFAGAKCGAAWNSLFLAITVAFLTTALGLCFALMVTRSGFRYKRAIRALTVLPIITPPFVIGLALILLFGLSGSVTVFFAEMFGVQPTRWLYGMPGVIIAQTLAYTPIAFLVLIGVVEGVSPSMEEASQTLRANRWQTFRTVSLPLMRPGLANAFLLGFIESMADFGNPLVLGGNFDVLSTEIFFAIVGAQYDQGRAAVLAMVLLFFTLSAFYAQRAWLGKKSYTTVSGKGDSGVHPLMPTGLAVPVMVIALGWAIFTAVVYGMIIYGSVVELWGVNNSLTFKHYITAFSVRFEEEGIRWTGAAWDSFWTTITIAAIAAPLTAAVGLVTAYLLTRQNFAGKNAFEFGTMLSFAIPGTVIGVSYILAFNVPPIEITGTGVILVISFIFRNMPVGVRAGIASMSQLDKSLDESSLTLGANSWQTFRRVILPLLRPAILAALVYSFVRAMTAISAVIFLVSAEYDMATSYIIGRVENNDYGLAIAYSTTLIFVMLTAVGMLQLLVGRVQIGRRTQQVAEKST
ncbi:iron ABC transporter permease [Roseobacter denitrificans]|uniref:Iron ABC transporter, permease protein, putative n=1 Tax=Roseobacter denitrificans (strain ATCC 33942 / OCh 114) TaxID=375451 RepID=Q16BC1_ROSDO|nr:iron ABC transporter permease [Roseobacter denitrificans]ABG30722.1 iron ABC transporter, permease protein, putative [Roseobacter denitrificans OCh 114]AVL53839.1 iron ABC transporter permease [Roseobacter denitrificans]SFG17877.1 iron(III) transport system permease protein [Roseobacter denitrificans OCh 114]